MMKVTLTHMSAFSFPCFLISSSHLLRSLNYRRPNHRTKTFIQTSRQHTLQHFSYYRTTSKNMNNVTSNSTQGEQKKKEETNNSKNYQGYLEREMQAARREKRPYNIDKSKMTQAEIQQLRLRSRAIPMVADKEPLDIIFEDEYFLVVNKPSFIKMHPSHRFQGGSLLNRAIGYLGRTPFILHRLDMHTTGVVLLAKKKEVCAPIMKQFKDGAVEKQYLCVVDGIDDSQRGSNFTVDSPIQRHNVSFVREVGNDKESSQEATTTFRVVDKSNEKKMMILEASPKTGRTHQIRVHISHSGYPIIGDDVYNPKENEMYASYDEISQASNDENLTKYGDGNVLRRGLKLHAWKINLVNPVTNDVMKFTADAPAHMQKLIQFAGMTCPPH